VFENFRSAALASTRLSLSPSVRKEKLCSHWKGFHRNWCLSIFRKSVEEIQFSLKSNKNKKYFTWRLKDIYGNILLKCRDIEKYSGQICRENIEFIPHDVFTKIVLFMEMCKKIWQNHTGHIWQYDACALHVVYLRLSKYIILNFYHMCEWLRERASLLR